MNYQKVYNDLITKRKQNPITKIRVNSKQELYDGCYTETHHIIPLCMNGPDIKTNLIELTAREHFVAHKLLFRAYIGTKFELPLGNAFWEMCYCHKDKAYKINKSSRLFAAEKRLAIQALSKQMKGRIRINNGQYNKMIWPEQIEQYLLNGWKLGGKPLSAKTKDRLSKSLKGKPHKPMSSETKHKISVKCKGYKFTDEQRQRLSNSRKGKPSNMKGKTHSAESKAKISKALKGNQYALGKIAVNNGAIQRMVYPDQIPDGFVIGSLPHKKISQAGIENMRRAQKGVKYYTNGTKVIRIRPNEEVPDGFIRGTRPCSESRKQKLRNKLKGRISPMKGRKHTDDVKKRISQSSTSRKHFTNGIQNIFVYPNDVPDGFYPGQTSKTKIEENHKNKMTLTQQTIEC